VRSQKIKKLILMKRKVGLNEKTVVKYLKRVRRMFWYSLLLIFFYSGLIFVSFQADIVAQFVPIQRRLDELDLLKMQDDTVIAEDDVLGRSGPQ